MNNWKFNDTGELLQQLLVFSKDYDTACILLSNNFEDIHGKYNLVAGFGEKMKYNDPSEIENNDQLKLGFISYDLKNKFENIESNNPSGVGVPDFYFFEPEVSLECGRDGSLNLKKFNVSPPDVSDFNIRFTADLNWKCKTEKSIYIENVNKIRSQIENGDFYEMNYCIEWEAENTVGFNPYEAFFKLNTVSPAPFAAFFKYNQKYFICSSPERFIQKKQHKIISQPIKGTRKRDKDLQVDLRIIHELECAEKDRSENIMIADLVRNDLSKICKNGSVKVDELCKIYSFSHVHQMISLVSGEIEGDPKFLEILRATFPMGSMTGAPKIMVMQEIERYENFRRGLYSGSIGWFCNGDFDLNVVIRSLQFNAKDDTLIYNVGGAIVYDSDAESEYDECETKAAGIIAAMNAN